MRWVRLILLSTLISSAASAAEPVITDKVDEKCVKLQSIQVIDSSETDTSKADRTMIERAKTLGGDTVVPDPAAGADNVRSATVYRCGPAPESKDPSDVFEAKDVHYRAEFGANQARYLGSTQRSPLPGIKSASDAEVVSVDIAGGVYPDLFPRTGFKAGFGAMITIDSTTSVSLNLEGLQTIFAFGPGAAFFFSGHFGSGFYLQSDLYFGFVTAETFEKTGPRRSNLVIDSEFGFGPAAAMGYAFRVTPQARLSLSLRTLYFSAQGANYLFTSAALGVIF